MPFTLACPSCGAQVTATANHVGRRVPCPRCNAPFHVRSPSNGSAAVPTAPPRADEATAEPFRAVAHWGVFVLPLVASAVIMLSAWQVGLAITAMSENGLPSVILLAGGAFGSGALVFAALMRYLTTELLVTDKKVIFTSGYLSRQTTEILLDKVESITLNEPLLGSVLGYGTIAVSGTGSSRQPFRHIADPHRCKRELDRRIFGG